MNIGLEFKQWLEGSYTKEDIPKYFFLCPFFRPHELVSGNLRGVEGLTPDINTALHFYKECLYIMDGPTTERDNNLSRILYSNPHYMMSKNLDAFNRTKKGSGNEDTGWSPYAYLAEKIASHARLTFNINVIKDKLASIIQDAADLNDLIKKTYRVISQLDPKFQDNWDMKKYREMIKYVVSDFSMVFQDEQEWRVKDQWDRTSEGKPFKLPALKMPKGSHLWLIADTSKLVEYHGLTKVYQVTYFVDEKNLKYTAKKVFVEGSGLSGWESLNMRAQKSQQDLAYSKLGDEVPNDVISLFPGQAIPKSTVSAPQKSPAELLFPKSKQSLVP